MVLYKEGQLVDKYIQELSCIYKDIASVYIGGSLRSKTLNYFSDIDIIVFFDELDEGKIADLKLRTADFSRLNNRLIDIFPFQKELLYTPIPLLHPTYLTKSILVNNSSFYKGIQYDHLFRNHYDHREKNIHSIYYYISNITKGLRDRSLGKLTYKYLKVSYQLYILDTALNNFKGSASEVFREINLDVLHLKEFSHTNNDPVFSFYHYLDLNSLKSEGAIRKKLFMNQEGLQSLNRYVDEMIPRLLTNLIEETLTCSFEHEHISLGPVLIKTGNNIIKNLARYRKGDLFENRKSFLDQMQRLQKEITI